MIDFCVVRNHEDLHFQIWFIHLSIYKPDPVARKRKQKFTVLIKLLHCQNSFEIKIGLNFN